MYTGINGGIEMDDKPKDDERMTYHCIRCNEPFQVKKGSRRSLCDVCLAIVAVASVTGKKEAGK